MSSSRFTTKAGRPLRLFLLLAVLLGAALLSFSPSFVHATTGESDVLYPLTGGANAQTYAYVANSLNLTISPNQIGDPLIVVLQTTGGGPFTVTDTNLDTFTEVYTNLQSSYIMPTNGSYYSDYFRYMSLGIDFTVFVSTVSGLGTIPVTVGFGGSYVGTATAAAFEYKTNATTFYAAVEADVMTNSTIYAQHGTAEVLQPGYAMVTVGYLQSQYASNGGNKNWMNLTAGYTAMSGFSMEGWQDGQYGAGFVENVNGTGSIGAVAGFACKSYTGYYAIMAESISLVFKTPSVALPSTLNLSSTFIGDTTTSQVWAFTGHYTGTMTISNWTLSYGDGNAATGSTSTLPFNLAHAYFLTNIYTVNLSVAFSDGSFQSTIQVISVDVVGSSAAGAGTFTLVCIPGTISAEPARVTCNVGYAANIGYTLENVRFYWGNGDSTLVGDDGAVVLTTIGTPVVRSYTYNPVNYTYGIVVKARTSFAGVDEYYWTTNVTVTVAIPGGGGSPTSGGNDVGGFGEMIYGSIGSSGLWMMALIEFVVVLAVIALGTGNGLIALLVSAGVTLATMMALFSGLAIGEEALMGLLLVAPIIGLVVGMKGSNGEGSKGRY